MRHRKKGAILGRKLGPRRSLLKNLAASLVLYEKVRTTEAKARLVRPYVERLITTAKQPTLAHRRQLLAKLPGEGPVKKLLEVLGPRYQDRRGGYTRTVKLGTRVGDQARVVQIEFI